MALDIALAVAAGVPLFGSMNAEKGDVLYLALEDSQRRLKDRMNKKGISQAPERLTLVTDWPRLDDGGIAEMEQWADAVENPALVIVDVFAKVRPPKGRHESPYDADYLPLSSLGQIARNSGIAMIVVHHLRKADADDLLESLSGTNGLTGAADSVMVLHKDSRTGQCRLYIRGRDIEEVERIVFFDRDTGTWSLLGELAEIGRTNERQAIMSLMRERDGPLAPKEAAAILGKNYEAVRKIMFRMEKAAEIEKVGKGQYRCPGSPTVPGD
jgi:hypothetical protein